MSENIIYYWCWYAGSACLRYLNTDTAFGYGFAVLFSVYATSCVSAFCTEVDVKLVVAGVDIKEG